MSEQYKHLYDNFFLKPGSPLYNDEIRQTLDSSGVVGTWFETEQSFKAIDCQNEFLEFFPEWISSSKLNTFIGLDAFPKRLVSVGATQTLDTFHFECQQEGRRMRFFRGEYPYNKRTVNWSPDQYIENSPLEENDAVILSFPFCGNGGKHEQYDWLLEECLTNKIPLLIDCAYFGTCGGLEVDLSHPAITDVCFSLTKGLSSTMFRAGIRFTKNEDKTFKMQTQTMWHHGIHLNLKVALFLMQNFSPDYNYEKYRPIQEMVCEEYDLEPTPCTHLAMGNEEWNHFLWDGKYIRIGLKHAIESNVT